MTTKVKGIAINLFDLLGAVSVQDMGPQNTDITSQVNTALAAGSPVFIPAGTWIIRNIILPAGSKLIGIGPQSILKLKDVINAVAITISGECYLSGFTLEGNKDNQAGGGFHGIEISGATNVIIDKVNVNNTKGSGFVVSGASDGVVFQNCQVSSYTDSGFKITRGTNITLNTPRVLSSDAAATGEGIAILSDGNVISNINIINPIVSKAVNRGIAIIGNGGRNVQDVTITSPRINTSGSHNIHIMSTDTVMIFGGSVKASSGDGIRIEGDVINCRINSVSIKNNLGYGLREIINGASPNFNGYIYNVLAGNANNAPAKVGANSFVL